MKAAYIYDAPARPAAPGTLSQVCSGLEGWLLKPYPAYGIDLPKNITELCGADGYIKTTYTYSPYGNVTSTGNAVQHIQWSCEYADTDLGLVYYNYRHYNPLDGRWTSRDVKRDRDANLYNFLQQTPFDTDVLGMESNVLSKCERFVAKYKEEMKLSKNENRPV